MFRDRENHGSKSFATGDNGLRIVTNCRETRNRERSLPSGVRKICEGLRAVIEIVQGSRASDRFESTRLLTNFERFWRARPKYGTAIHFGSRDNLFVRRCVALVPNRKLVKVTGKVSGSSNRR